MGAGPGTLSLFCKNNLNNARVCAIDLACWGGDIQEKFYSEVGIEYKKVNVETEEIPFDNKFDIIIFTEVMEHFVYYPVPTLIKIKNKLKENGTLYLTTPNANVWGKELKYHKKLSDIPHVLSGERYTIDNKSNGGHVWQYTLEELNYVFIKSGLMITNIDYSYNINNSKAQFNFALKRIEDVSSSLNLD